MKDVAIVESGKEFKFSGTGKLETELQNGGSCYWVPKEERETGHIFASENRDYTADEISKYGISSVDVNIFFTGITDDGEPWSVTIDPDTELPIIDIGDIEITIDDIGDIDIHIPGGDPDDWPGWDDLDPDLKQDFDDWVNPHDPDDWPGWDDLDPDLKQDFDDWVNDGNDPDDWPGWEDLDPSIKDDFDGFVNPHDPDSWPGWNDLDPSIKDSFDDWTSDIDTSIDDSMLDDMGIDIDDNIDISVDDLGNIDISNGDISVNLDPITGEWDTDDCPASIQVMHTPSKTEYTDGLAIDYDGLVVQAFDKDGNAWSSRDYPDGYIPVHKLNLPKYSDITEADANVEVPDYAPINNADSVISIGPIIDIFQDHFPDNISEAQKETMRDSISGYVSDAAISYAWCNGNLPPAGTSIVITRWTGCVVITGQPGKDNLCDAVRYSWDLSYYQSPLEGGSTSFNLNGPRIENIKINLFQGYEEETGLLSNANASIPNYSQPIDAEWVSPCLNTLSSSFEITINPKQDHDGSHFSGKF